jgi:N-methylhydantoinase A
VQGVSYRVELVVPSAKLELTPAEPDGGPPPPARTIEIRHFDDEPLQAAELDRSALPVGARLDGPAVIREDLATTFVCPGQVVTVGRFGELVIERAG